MSNITFWLIEAKQKLHSLEKYVLTEVGYHPVPLIIKIATDPVYKVSRFLLKFYQLFLNKPHSFISRLIFGFFDGMSAIKLA